MSLFTNTIQSVINFAATHIELLPITGVGGFTNEPALSLANDTLGELIANPMAWKFNRVEMPLFVTTPFQQDYQFGGAVILSGAQGHGIALKSAGAPGVQQTTTVITVTTLEPHTFVVGDQVYMFGNVDAAYNSTYSQLPTGSAYSNGWVVASSTAGTTTLTLTSTVSTSATSGAPGITNFQWLESGTMREINSAAPIPQNWELYGVNDIHPTSQVSRPTKVAVMTDNGDGTIKIRFNYGCPTVIYGVSLVYQAMAPLKSALTGAGVGDWSPFPDRLAYVYRQMFLARCYRYLNSPRADMEYQKANAAIAKALGVDDAEQSDQYITPAETLLSGGWYYDGF